MKIKANTPVSFAIVVIFFCALCPSGADAGDSSWQIRIFGLSMNPTGDTVVVPNTGEQIAFDTENGYGLGFDLEYRVSSRLGIDIGALTASPVVDVLIDEVGAISASAEPRITPLHVGLTVHLTPESPVDLYFEPMFAYVIYSSFNLVVNPWFCTQDSLCVQDFETENDFGIGINLGVDVRLGGAGWLLTAAFKYLDTTLVASPPDESVGRTDIDPMIFTVGVGFAF
jgi:outer membrane protein W